MKPVRWIFYFVIIGILLFALGLFASPTHAQTISPQPTQATLPANPYVAPDTNPDVPKNLHTFTQSVMLEVASSLICQIGGYDVITHTPNCLGLDPTSRKIGYVKSGGGLIGFTGGMISGLYTPPFHTADYFKYMAGNFGFVNHAYAQGVGFSQLSPLIKLWSTFRNIVYLFFVVIFILVGFAIMLRVRIDPRTVMTIQNQLPKLVIGLLLVTFSFAIAGFLVDLMWVTVFLVINILLAADPNIQSAWGVGTKYALSSHIFDSPVGFANDMLNGGIIGVAIGAGGSMGGIIKNLFSSSNVNPFQVATVNCNGFDPFCWAGQALPNVLGAIVGNVLYILVSIIGTLVVLIAILIAMFRLWFSLLISYAYILLYTVFSPFYIAIGLLPGSKTGFTSWLRGLSANLAAFPAAIAMFMIGRLFMDGFVPTAQNNSLFVPPLIGNPNGANQVGFLLGLAIILMTPQVVTFTKEALKAPQSKFGAAAAAGFGAGAAALTGTAKTGFGTAGAAMFDPYGKRSSENAFGRVFTRMFR